MSGSGMDEKPIDLLFCSTIQSLSVLLQLIYLKLVVVGTGFKGLTHWEFWS